MTTTISPPTREESLARLGPTPSLARAIAVSKALAASAGDVRIVRYAILRNVTLEPGIVPAIRIAAAEAGFDADAELGEFDAAQPEALDASSVAYRDGTDVVVVALQLRTLAPDLALAFASLSPERAAELEESALSRVVEIARTIRARSSAAIVVHGFEISFRPALGFLDAAGGRGQRAMLARLNLRLGEAIGAISNAFVIDVERHVAMLGYAAAIDDRYWHIGRAPYTFALERSLARDYVAIGRALVGKQKKCLVLDCDNTLWGGVIGEDGLEGIALGPNHPGSSFVEFQAAALDLYHRGILLALASKNNDADAMEVFEKHPSSLLKPEHFVTRQVNWNDKASNLRAIAQTLNIGLDSLVFADDNPVECALVRERLPSVEVLELSGDPSGAARKLRELTSFDTLGLSDEDRRRSELYRAEAARTELAASAGSMEDYLASLDMTIEIERADAFAIPRIAQLTQKTNQFNLTTRRYGVPAIEEMSASRAWDVYYARVTDKFSDSGIVAVALLERTDAATLRLDTLLMSCRVIARGVETAFLRAIVADAAAAGVTKVDAEFIPTPKNDLAKAFLGENGFERRADGHFELDVATADVALPAWFRRTARNEERS